ncbi:MAG: sodium:solute symporter [Bacteroidales bacterium]|nr:sodium:solute symporter [Bacteroidales bacterium]NLK81414.1 sodium:solute symporter [Bacteroidales bacterium]
MNQYLVAFIIICYFGLLIFISRITSKNADNSSFFNGNRKAPWYVIAFGMIGSSLSGVTFIALPGWVGNSHFYYFQLVIGYFIGYIIIANILLPLYYKLNLTSIYTYLEQRFGDTSYKTGAVFFLISRTLGSALRLFIVARVLQIAFFDYFNIPFVFTAIATVLLIWVYTNKGGLKTIIWTDTLQTFFLIAAVIFTIITIAKEIDFGGLSMIQAISNSEYSTIINTDWNSKFHFLKQIVSGMLITIVMTGLDQDMMQKNLSCRNLKDAKKNMYWYASGYLVVNLVFLALGALLYMYINQIGLDMFAQSDFGYNAETQSYVNTDDLYPFLAMNNFGVVTGIVFLIGIIAAAFSSADSALAALTTSFTIDIIGIKNKTEQEIKKQRQKSHILFSGILAIVIIAFHMLNDNTVIDAIFTIASYTYGPILGMYAFGLSTTRAIKDSYMLPIAIASPCVCLVISFASAQLFHYSFGYEILLLNGLLTYAGMLLISSKQIQVKI